MAALIAAGAASCAGYFLGRTIVDNNDQSTPKQQPQKSRASCFLCDTVYQSKELVVVFTCGHMVHKGCVDKLNKLKQGMQCICPVCHCNVVVAAFAVAELNGLTIIKSQHSAQPPQAAVVMDYVKRQERQLHEYLKQRHDDERKELEQLLRQYCTRQELHDVQQLLEFYGQQHMHELAQLQDQQRQQQELSKHHSSDLYHYLQQQHEFFEHQQQRVEVCEHAILKLHDFLVQKEREEEVEKEKEKERKEEEAEKEKEKEREEEAEKEEEKEKEQEQEHEVPYNNRQFNEFLWW